MARVKGGTVSKNRRRKVLKQAKGYFGSKHRLYKRLKNKFSIVELMLIEIVSKEKRFQKTLDYTFNAACRMNDISYSKFMNGLSIAGIEINRKMLSELAIDNPKAFTELVEVSKKALNGGVKETKAVKEEVKEEKISKKVEKKEEVKEEASTKDYSKMTLAELKAVAKEQGLKGYSTMKKDELISNLK